MSIDIKELSEKDLQQKIDAIKAEREKTANALKRYEEELEQRKQKVSFGIPLDEALSSVFSCYQFGFASEKSQRLFHARLTDYVEALRKLAEGKPIDIKVLLPLMKKGYVAMDANGIWCWFSVKPELYSNGGIWNLQARSDSRMVVISAFNIKPAEDWTKSLQECGL